MGYKHRAGPDNPGVLCKYTGWDGGADIILLMSVRVSGLGCVQFHLVGGHVFFLFLQPRP